MRKKWGRLENEMISEGGKKEQNKVPFQILKRFEDVFFK